MHNFKRVLIWACFAVTEHGHLPLIGVNNEFLSMPKYFGVKCEVIICLKAEAWP